MNEMTEKEKLLRMKKLLEEQQDADIARELYLKKLLDGEIQGPLTGIPFVDKPWLKFYDEDFLRQPIPHTDIYDYMKEKTYPYKDMTAMTYFGRKIKYKDFYKNIDTASKVLSEIGVKNNDRVMYLLPNIPETAYLMYGTTQLGAVCDYVDPRPDSIDMTVSAKKILSLFEKENANHLVVLDQCYLAMIKPIEKELKDLGLEKIVLVSASDSMDLITKFKYMKEITDFSGIKTLKEQLKKTSDIEKMVKKTRESSCLEILDYSKLVKECKNKTFKKAEYEPNKLNLIVHTSGTSSPMPKAIPLTNDNLNFYVHQTFGANMPISPGDNALHALPYFAAFGVVNIAHSLFCHANNLVQVPELDIANLGKIANKYDIQNFIGLPSWVTLLCNDPNMKDFSRFKMLTYGGDSKDEAEEISDNKVLKEKGAKIKVTKGHGMSELAGCATYSTDEYNYLNVLGIPLPHTSYGVVDPDTKELLSFGADKNYVEGELIVSTKAATSGILDRNVIVPHTNYEGEDCIYTRDIARMYKNGVIKFLSRSDRSFTRFDGFKFKPYEVENVIINHPLVKKCVISPYYSEEELGNRAVANIVLNSDEELSVDEQVEIVEKIVNDCFSNNPNVSTRQVPSKFRFRKSIPLTPNGKMDFKSIENEELNGNEITVDLEETNISIGDIKIYGPEKGKTLLKRM